MSNKQQFNARVRHKTGKYADWEQAANSFKPLLGEIIVYIPNDVNDTRPTRLKVGDGEKFINELDFITNPEGGGNAPGGASDPQVQTDYSQNDTVAVDYIKNRPFYSIPPEHNFNLGLNRAFEEYIWDGDTSNRPGLTIKYQGVEVSWYKVSDAFYKYEDILNGYAYISAIPKNQIEEMQAQGVQSYLVPIPLTTEVLNSIIMYSDPHYLIGMGAVSTDTAGVLSLPDENGEIIEFDFPEPGTYYTYDKFGALFGTSGSYTRQIVGPADVLNDSSFMLAPDIYGAGTYLAFKKVSDLFFDKSSLLNTGFTMAMISHDPSEMFDGMYIQYKVSEEMLNDMRVMASSTDNSYALTANGIPLFASFETDSGEINGMVPGKGTYLMYSDMGAAEGRMILYLDNFNSGETIYQIDPKYIPNASRLAADWNQTNSEDITYIRNKPFEFNDIYLRDFIDPADSSIKAFIDDNLNNYYGLVGKMKLPYRSDSSFRVELISPCISINDSYFYLSNITEWYSGNNTLNFSIYSLGGQEVITSSTTLAVYVESPCYESVYINGEYVHVTFPEPGLYYLYHQDLNVKTKYASYLEYYWNTDRLQPDWNQTDGSHPGYIKNKPNITVTSDINSYSSSPVSSSGVYYALGGRSSISTTSSVSSGSNSLVTSDGVYTALQNVKVTTDSSVSSSSTNPIQSKAIYTALGNRASLTFDTYPQSGSNNPITSDAVYDAIGGQSISKTTSVISGSNSLITSGGIYTALGNRTKLPTISSTVSSGSSNIMTSGGVYTALGNRTALTFDDTPTSGSSDLMTSGAIYNALQNIEIDVDDSITETSTNPVSSAAIYEAINNISISEADTVDGYHFRVSTETPLSKDVTEKTITFVI